MWKEVCHNHCHIDGAPEFQNALEDACGQYRHVLPKPKVYMFCKRGFEDSLSAACDAMCTTKSHSSSASQTQGAQFCKAFKREMPKPGAHAACVAGHSRGGNVAHHWAQAKLQEYNALKAATGASDQVIEEVMEKEAEIEEQIAQNHQGGGKISEKEIKKEFEEIEEKENLQEKAKDELELAREAARAAFNAQEEGGEDAAEEEEGENATEIDL
jgi:hypothetical protein